MAKDILQSRQHQPLDEHCSKLLNSSHFDILSRSHTRPSPAILSGSPQSTLLKEKLNLNSSRRTHAEGFEIPVTDSPQQTDRSQLPETPSPHPKVAAVKKDLPLLQHGGYAATSPTASSVSSSYSRVASEELIVPAPDSVNSVYYGVDAFSPTLVDFYTVDQKRIVWSSRAHRKMITTLYRAWHGKSWKIYSLSFWAGICAIVAFTLFITGLTGETVAHSARGSKAAREPGNQVHSSVDLPLLLAAVFFLAYHTITYLEVINCCHNLEIWLEEYFHGTEPVLERQFVGVFPSRIDFWTALLGMLGSLLYVFARAYVWVRSDTENFGVVDVKRDDFSLIVGYWVPFFAGSFLLLLSAYLAHVEVVHQWFSCRLTTLETWVTGLNMMAMIGFFLSSTLQFMDPFSVLFSFQACVVPFASGCLLGLGSNVLSLVELENIHKRHKHPEYGLYASPAGYGTASYGSFKQQA